MNQAHLPATQKSMKSCGTCARGFMQENGKVACGAAVDDDALLAMSVGNNPTWAWRKYGPFALLGLSTKNTDCDNMDPSDGTSCAVYQPTDNQQNQPGKAIP